jgi:hypothetical protein
MMFEAGQIDTGDYVHHGPTNEDWIVAAVEDQDLYWCGWPFGGSAKLADCTLIKKSGEEFRLKILNEVATARSNERPVYICQSKLAEIQRLKEGK